MQVIEVKNVYKYYKVGQEVVKALDGIDFEILEGEFCAIVGTSGSGKSTLLNLLAGLEPPSHGEIIVNQRHLEKLGEDELVSFRRNNIGFIFQSYQLLQTMTALENVALTLSFRGVPRKVREKKAVRMLDLVNLQEHMSHMPSQMSGGQQQRVGVARALVMEPKIIFADEPTGNLDTKTSRDIMTLMKEIVEKQKRTLIMVTHDDALASYANRIIKIIDGKIVSITVKENIVSQMEVSINE
ncbi:ABC transporter ATP-binding protein [Granulicatella seriolae]|uniref:ABC transporter ATP-binding protein n=1 Tax=Granulicatella seriolae TaxID=2967226 RepID=A0ABT1WLA0_9LACT|nr:ABC transporter ATP-binding protein [Granulicatella seriolae]